jgi:hypothetical protein
VSQKVTGKSSHIHHTSFTFIYFPHPRCAFTPTLCAWAITTTLPRRTVSLDLFNLAFQSPAAAELHHIPQSMASSLWHKWLDTGSTHALPQSGHPPKVTDCLSFEIVQESIINCREPLCDIGLSLTTPVSALTVQNVLSHQGQHH